MYRLLRSYKLGKLKMYRSLVRKSKSLIYTAIGNWIITKFY